MWYSVNAFKAVDTMTSQPAERLSKTSSQNHVLKSKKCCFGLKVDGFDLLNVLQLVGKKRNHISKGKPTSS